MNDRMLYRNMRLNGHGMNIIADRTQGAAIMLGAAALADLKDELIAVEDIVNRSRVYGDVSRFGDLPLLAELAERLGVRS